MKKNIFIISLCLVLLFSLLPVSVSASEAVARDISDGDLIAAAEGFPSKNALFDGRLLSGKESADDPTLTLEYEEGIGSLYFLFDQIREPYIITDNTTGESQIGGVHGFLHDFVDLQALFGTAPTSVTITFQGRVTLYELYVYTAGKVPDSVQKWQAPADGKTDLVLFSTHGDDEQLFFAGVLPYYAGERGYQVQVVYLTDHREDDPHRIHEMLNGLWAVGVTAYPVAGSYPDFLIKHDMAGTYKGFERRGHSREEMLGFVVENIRRFKPLVAVGHDINGEYGHGMHMVYTDLLMEAVAISNDPSRYPESAEAYGLWDTPKTYLHLYEENPIVMDWDQPLSRFDNMTAFEVTQQLGFTCHVSQYQDFAWYLVYAKDAASVRKYNPCYYGLYRSTVGDDILKNDFFENLNSYEETARLEEEARLEAERRAEEERKARESRMAEAQRIHAAHLAAEKAAKEKAAAESAAAEVLLMQQASLEQHQKQAELTIALSTVAALVLLLVVLLIVRNTLGQKRKKKNF